MILTGKAKEDFEKWLSSESLINQINDICVFEIANFKCLSNVSKHALIIEWFDSVGYNFNVGLSFIKTKPYKCELYISINDNVFFKGKFLSPKQIEATEQAIIKSNEIYNQRNTN